MNYSSNSEDKVSFMKLAAITATVEYLSKIAEAQGAEPLTTDQIAIVTERCDSMIPDSVITTMNNEDITTKIVDSIAQAAQELAEEAVKPELQIKQEDMGIHPVGSGIVVKEVATDPNANTGGVVIIPEIPVMDTQLMAVTPNADKKVASVVEGLIKNANLVSKLNKEKNMSKVNKLTEASIKLANIANELLKIAQEQITVSDNEADKLQGQAVSTQDSDKSTAPAAATSIQNNVEDLTKDPELGKDKTEAQAAEESGANPPANPQHKEAGSAVRTVKDLIAKHKKG